MIRHTTIILCRTPLGSSTEVLILYSHAILVHLLIAIIAILLSLLAPNYMTFSRPLYHVD